MRRLLDRFRAWQGNWFATGRTRWIDRPRANGIAYGYELREEVSDAVEGRTRWVRSGHTRTRYPDGRVVQFRSGDW